MASIITPVQHPRRQPEALRKVPRWATPRYQSATRKDAERSPEFNHKASHVLGAEGFSGPATAKVLGVSLRAVRDYLARACKALEVEQQEAARRERVAHFETTTRGRAPFDVWAYLREAEVPAVVDLLGFDPWERQDIGATTREKVAFYIMDGWSQGEVSRILGISKQAVSKHALALRVQQGRHHRRTVQP